MKLPITPKTSKADKKRLMLRTAASFSQCKDTALACRKSGDTEGARFWASQARHDWNRISQWLAA